MKALSKIGWAALALLGAFCLGTVALRRGAQLRSYAYDFIHSFAPHLDPEVVRQAQSAPAGTPAAPL